MRMFAMCFDRRVLIGLGLVAVAIWVYAPQLFLAALPVLLLLACPLSMVLMMRMMGQHSGAPSGAAGDPAAQLAALEREQARLAGEIEHVRRAAALSTPAETQQLPERVPTARA